MNKKSLKSVQKKDPNLPKEDLAHYYFHQGTNFNTYDYLGVHRVTEKGKNVGYVFRTWAPAAHEIYVLGDFNAWEKTHPMKRITEMGVWECFVKTELSLEDTPYKYVIISKAGEHYKADPYATYSETGLKTASLIHTESTFDWKDASWFRHRKKAIQNGYWDVPLNIYEMHLASWRKKEADNDDDEGYFSYREIADMLVPYVKEMGYTHVELLPITEFPYYASWGYQVTGYFAPTSRFGNPEDFKYFINKLHTNGIGVILDWVPAHFPKDEHGLRDFDGSPLYEYQGTDRMEHKEWGTRCFDVGRNEVQCFLISSALYWLREFHIDGLRVDAVASMLYLDYAREPGEWIPNVYGTNENLESQAFFRKLNKTIFAEFPDILMIAEESTAFGKVTKPVHEGGLGFNFKWNMGWSNDMFDYVKCDPFFRKNIHDKLTFSLCYAFSENYILTVSHDEVVHGKKSLIDKMYGSYEQKFAGIRLFLAYQMAHPGKKMLFMGCEYGQFREWDFATQLEWFMLDYETHSTLRTFTSKLNNFYLKTPQLWEVDFTWDGFDWIYPDMRDENLVAFRRFDKAGNELIAVMNFSAAEISDLSIPARSESYRVAFSTDNESLGGSGISSSGILRADEYKNIHVKLAPLSGLMILPRQTKKQKTEQTNVKITEEVLI
ncbi:MAG: 1,4-alpha-glucan branching protein GlgB [Clostridia bacterium]|nr:1,4-alpha-glucan branching protein GlgB [Clostridia bacterium]